MNTEEYINASARTNQRKNEGKTLSAFQIELLHGAMGLSTEANELLDMMKKNIFYGNPIDVPNIVEECGDAMWYISLILREAGFSFEEVMQINIDKLKLRFPEKFEEHQAIDRDVAKERKLLEDSVSIKLKAGDKLVCLNDSEALKAGDEVVVMTDYCQFQGETYIVKVSETVTLWVEKDDVKDGYFSEDLKGERVCFKRVKNNV